MEETATACQGCKNVLGPADLYCRECFCLQFAADLEPPTEDERIITLAQATELLLSGEWDAASFRAFIEEVRDQQARRAEAIQAALRFDEDADDENEVGLHGLNQCQTALVGLSTWMREPPATHEAIVALLRDFYVGVCGVKQAMRINRSNRGDDDERSGQAATHPTPPKTPGAKEP